MREQIGIDVTARDLASKELGRVQGAVTNLAKSTGAAVPPMNALGGAQMGMAQKAFFVLQNLQSVQWAISMATSVMQPAVDAARDYAESYTKINTVLGEHAQLLHTAAETSARTMGLSTNQVLKYGGEYANLFRAMKLSEEESSKMSLATIQLASDISSFNNIPMDEALAKLRSGLVGEYLPMRTVGVQMNELIVGAKGVELQFAATAKELTAQQKVQARFAVMTEQLELTVGDFARTQYGLANQQRVAAAVMQDNMMKAGEALIPIFLTLTQATIGFMEVVIPIIKLLGSHFPAVIAGVIVVLIGLAGGLVPAITMMGAFAMTTWLAIAPLLPFIAIGVLVAGTLILLEENFGFVSGAINLVSEAIGAVVGFIKDSLVVAIQILANIVGIFDKGMSDSLRAMSYEVRDIGVQTTAVVEATEEEARAIVARGIPGMENISNEYFSALPDAAGKAKQEVLNRTSQIMSGVADSLKKGRDEVKSARDFLKEAIKEAMSPAKEKKDLKNFLDSGELKKALKSQDAIVRAAALSAEQSAKERLFALKNSVPDLAVDAQVSYDDAYAQVGEAVAAEMFAAQEVARLETEKRAFFYEAYAKRTMDAYADGIRSGREGVVGAVRGVLNDVSGLLVAKSPPTIKSPLHEIDTWGERTINAFGDGMRRAGVALRQSAAVAVAASRPAFDAAPSMGSAGYGSESGSVVINNNFQPQSIRKDEDIRRLSERLSTQVRLRGGLRSGSSTTNLLI